LERVVLVGDRGTLTPTQIDHLKQSPGLGWIAALRFAAIRKLADTDTLDGVLVAHEPLAEITAAPCPGARLVACYPPLVAQERQRKRPALLEATEHDRAAIVREGARRTKTPLGQAEMGKQVGQVLPRSHMAKHCTVPIADNRLSYARRPESSQREAAWDGIDVIRTSEPAERLAAEDTVRGSKNWAVVERLFRTLKRIASLVRPMHHHQDKRVRAHIFLCVRAYDVEWHRRQALAPLLFDDEEREQHRQTRDPVAPAQPSPATHQKKASRLTADGLPIHSFHTLLAALGTRCRNRCRVTSGLEGLMFSQLTEPTPLQQRAFQLLGLVFPVNGKAIATEPSSSQ
jgi:hypothetical protein